ncbi:MAG: hypothetical protein AAGC49_01695 [Brevundimonas sp.]
MFSLSPLTPQGFLVMELRRRYSRALSTSDRGASAIEWVIITGILVAMAAAVGLIIYNVVRDKANNINTPEDPTGIKGGGA